jgi:hypothetical protein
LSVGLGLAHRGIEAPSARYENQSFAGAWRAKNSENRGDSQELAGFRIDRVRFFVFVDCPHTQTMHALELLIEPVTWSSRFMQRGGWGRYRSRFDYRRHLPADEIRQVCAAVGYQRDTGIPAWLDGILLGGPLSALTLKKQRTLRISGGRR